MRKEICKIHICQKAASNWRGFYDAPVDSVDALDPWCDSRYKIFQCSSASDAAACQQIGSEYRIIPCKWKSGRCVHNTVLPRSGVFKLTSTCEVDTKHGVNSSTWHWTNPPHLNIDGTYENIAIRNPLAIVGQLGEDGALPIIKPAEDSDLVCKDETTTDCGALFSIYPGGSLILQNVKIQGFRYRRGYQSNEILNENVHLHDFVTLISLQTTSAYYTFPDHPYSDDPSFQTQNERHCSEDIVTNNGPRKRKVHRHCY